MGETDTQRRSFSRVAEAQETDSLKASHYVSRGNDQCFGDAAVCVHASEPLLNRLPAHVQIHERIAQEKNVMLGFAHCCAPFCQFLNSDFCRENAREVFPNLIFLLSCHP